jgi:excisionase family DNA binding protein
MEDNQKQPEPYVNMHRLMDHFKVSRPKVEAMIHEGLPMLRLGRSRRFKITEVEEWLKAKQEDQHERA